MCSQHLPKLVHLLDMVKFYISFQVDLLDNDEVGGIQFTFLTS